MGQEPYKLRYFIYEIKDKKEIVIEKQGDRSKTFDDLVEELPENDCRYALIDLEFKTADGRPTSKIVFISWNSLHWFFFVNRRNSLSSKVQ